MATVYHRDQAGAPALVYGPSYGFHFPAFKEILKACLVFGYGSKPAAGWSLVAEGANYLVLRNGTKTGYVCFTTNSEALVSVYLSETYTGVSVGVMVGDGLKTGVAAGATSPQKVMVGALAYSSAQSSWFLIADAATAIFQGCGTNGSDVVESSPNNSISLYLGDDDAGNFLAIGGQNTAAVNASNAFTAAGFTSLKNPATGLLVGAGSLSVSTPSLTLGATVRPYSDSVSMPVIPLCPVGWVGGGALAGNLRGIVQTPMISLMTADTAAKCLGLSGMTTRTINSPVDMGDGAHYFLAANATESALRLITDNPEFW